MDTTFTFFYTIGLVYPYLVVETMVPVDFTLNQSRMSRLAQLLRQFQLPPGASGAQLRQAYFRRNGHFFQKPSGSWCPWIKIPDGKFLWDPFGLGMIWAKRSWIKLQSFLCVRQAKKLHPDRNPHGQAAQVGNSWVRDQNKTSWIHVPYPRAFRSQGWFESLWNEKLKFPLSKFVASVSRHWIQLVVPLSVAGIFSTARRLWRSVAASGTAVCWLRKVGGKNQSPKELFDGTFS